jgi:4-oxalocrotonate tautomerase
MPHVIVKLWPGKSEDQKTHLAEAITRDVASILNYGDASISVGFDEVAAADWRDQVYEPHIAGTAATLYKKPGYGPADL